MKLLYDYLPIYIKESDVYELFLKVIKDEGRDNQVYLLMDSFVHANDYELSNLLSTSVHFLRGKINRSTPTLLEIEERIKDYDLFTCFNNGLSIPKNTSFKCRIFITNLLPLFKKPLDNNTFEKKYNDAFRNILEGDHRIVVFSNFHKDLLTSEGISEEEIIVTPPTLPSIYSEMDKVLCTLYLSSKFNINYKYFLLIGSCNEGFNLNRVLECIGELKLTYEYKFVFLMRTSNGSGFLEFKDIISKESNCEIFKDFSPLDEVNFIGGCEGIIDFSSPYIVSLSSLKGKAMNRKIITDMNLLNLEWLEDYPTYW
ncbi:MAG: hypothetical protein ACRC7N_10495 [Clostridium sp.]